METKSYSYGTKLAGILFHLFFSVIFTVAVFLLALMIEKNIFSITDIGTENFLNSGYYTKCMEQKCSDLSEYIRLLQKGENRNAEEERLYLQYTNKFKQEDSNFCFWYKQNGIWYTNQPDKITWQCVDTQSYLM